MKKFITIFIYAVLVIFLFINKDVWLTLIRSGGELSVVISIVLFTLLVFFPAIPFIVAAGIIGASFGVVQASIITITGVMFGTVFMFLLARYGFQGWTQSLLAKHEKVKRYEQLFEKNAFLSIFALRVFPVLPTPVVNVLCGVSTVQLLTYTIASTLGKLPRILIFTIAGQQATENVMSSFVIYGLYFLIIAVCLGIWHRRKLV